jgi:hypothetical protein
LNEHSKPDPLKIAQYVCELGENFKELLKCFLGHIEEQWERQSEQLKQGKAKCGRSDLSQEVLFTLLSATELVKTEIFLEIVRIIPGNPS